MSFKGVVDDEEIYAKAVLIGIMFVVFKLLESTGGYEGFFKIFYLVSRDFFGGVPGIFLMHFAHDEQSHFYGNVPFLFSLLVLLGYVSNDFKRVLLWIALMSGTFIWWGYSNVVIVGASAVIFGLFVYIPLKVVFNLELYIALKTSQYIEVKRSLLRKKVSIMIITFVLFVVYQDVIHNGMPGNELDLSVLADAFKGLFYGLPTPDSQQTASGKIIGKWAHAYGALAGLIVFFCESVCGVIRLRKSQE